MKSAPIKRHLSLMWAIGIALASTLAPLGAHPWSTTSALLPMLKAVVITPDNPLTSLGANQSSFILPDNPPVISSQPQNQRLIPGSDVTFSVSAGGSAPLSYQWRKDNVNIGGATASSYTRRNVQAIDEGNYSVVISNAGGSATSADALLAFIIAPTITVQPQNQTVGSGENVTLTVTVTGAKPLTYQWAQRTISDGMIDWISATIWTNSSLTLTNVQQGTMVFHVTVNNAYGSAVSSNAVLTVNAAIPPAITNQPQSQTVFAGRDAIFSVTATGTAPLSYQWRKDAVNIDGATASTYTRTNSQVIAEGSYSVIVSNAVGSATSTNALLAVIPERILRITSPNLRPAGRLNFDVSGPVGSNFFLQISTNLTQWMPVHYDTLLDETNGILDNYWIALPRHFYRVVLGESAISVAPLSNLTAGAFSLLQLPVTGLDTNANLSVRFLSTNGFLMEVPVLTLSSNGITVPMPVWQSTGDQVAPLQWQIVQQTATSSVVSRTFSNLQLSPPPVLATAPGVVTMSLLRAVLRLATNNVAMLTNTALDTVEIRQKLSNQMLLLSNLVADLGAVVNDPVQTLSLGTLEGNSLLVHQSDLAMTDRLIISAVEAWGAIEPSSAPLRTRVGTADKPYQTAASATADAARRGDDAALQLQLDQLLAPHGSDPGLLRGATLVFAGGAAVGVGALGYLALTGALTLAALPVAIGAGILGALAICFDSASEQHILQYELSQATDAARQTTRAIHREYDAFVAPVLAPLLVKASGRWADVLRSARDLRQSVITAPISPLPRCDGCYSALTASNTRSYAQYDLQVASCGNTDIRCINAALAALFASLDANNAAYTACTANCRP